MKTTSSVTNRMIILWNKSCNHKNGEHFGRFYGEYKMQIHLALINQSDLRWFWMKCLPTFEITWFISRFAFWRCNFTFGDLMVIVQDGVNFRHFILYYYNRVLSWVCMLVCLPIIPHRLAKIRQISKYTVKKSLKRIIKFQMRKIFERGTFETFELLRSYKDLPAYTINRFYKIRIHFLFESIFGSKMLGNLWMSIILRALLPGSGRRKVALSDWLSNKRISLTCSILICVLWVYFEYPNNPNLRIIRSDFFQHINKLWFLIFYYFKWLI